VDRVSLRLAMKSVEIESRLPQFFQRRCCMQRVQPNDDASLQSRRDLRRSTRFEQLLESSVPKAANHVVGL
jgi:hypothetical protein